TGDAGSGSFAGSLSGSAGLVKRGAGSFTLTGDHSYTGPTTVQAGTLLVNGTLASLTLAVDGGALSLGGANRLADSAAVSVASGAMMTLGGADTIGSLLLAGTLNGSFTLSAASYALDGGTVNAQLGAGSLSSTGNSRLNGSAAATLVAVDGGTLTLGAANLLADAAAVSVAGGATLSIQHSDTVGTLALAGTLAGSGTLTASTVTLSGGTVNANLGPGTVASSGSSTLNGLAASDTVTLAGGMLTLGAAHRFSAAPAITVGAGATLSTGTDQVFGSLAGAGNVQLGSAALTTGSAGSSSFAGNLSGSGQLTKTGASTFTLAGANAFSGTANVAAGSLAVDGTLAASVLNINAGSLILGASERLADNAAVTVAAGGTLSLAGSETVGSLVLSGRLDGIGSLTAPTYALSGGTVAAGAHLGAGTLTSSGASQLDGSSGANLVSITSGRLTLGSAERLSNSAAVSVDAGAALRLNGDETVGSITLSGTLDGTGKL
ncbi:MAG: autotransporter-associated beta strand repeat-containing protein, partial [Rhodoglobus sp.]|nr:autotransporter-associated beta strand repeat-containing protein [Rhodoglobus sp.]